MVKTARKPQLTAPQYEMIDEFLINEGKVNIFMSSYTGSGQRTIRSMEEKGFVVVERGEIHVTDEGREAAKNFEEKKVKPKDGEESSLKDDEYQTLFAMMEAKKEFTFPEGTFQSGHFKRMILKRLEFKGFVTINPRNQFDGYPYETVSITEEGKFAKTLFEKENGIILPTEDEKTLNRLIYLGYHFHGQIPLFEPNKSPEEFESTLSFLGYPCTNEMRRLAGLFPEELHVWNELLFVRQCNEMMFNAIKRSAS